MAHIQTAVRERHRAMSLGGLAAENPPWDKAGRGGWGQSCGIAGVRCKGSGPRWLPIPEALAAPKCTELRGIGSPSDRSLSISHFVPWMVRGPFFHSALAQASLLRAIILVLWRMGSQVLSSLLAYPTANFLRACRGTTSESWGASWLTCGCTCCSWMTPSPRSWILCVKMAQLGLSFPPVALGCHLPLWLTHTGLASGLSFPCPRQTVSPPHMLGGILALWDLDSDIPGFAQTA